MYGKEKEVFCIVCKRKMLHHYYGRYKDGYTCQRICDGIKQAELLKQFDTDQRRTT